MQVGDRQLGSGFGSRSRSGSGRALLLSVWVACGVGLALIASSYMLAARFQRTVPVRGMGTVVLKQGPGGALSVGEVQDASDSSPDVEMLPLGFGWPSDGSRVYVVGMNGGRMPARTGSGLESLGLRWRYDVRVHAKVDEILPGDTAREGARNWTTRRVHAAGEYAGLARCGVSADSGGFFAITEKAAAVLGASPAWSGFEGFDGSSSLVLTRETPYGQVVFSLSRSDVLVPFLFGVGVALVAASIGGVLFCRLGGMVLPVEGQPAVDSMSG